MNTYRFGETDNLANRADAREEMVALRLVSGTDKTDILRGLLLVAVKDLPSCSLGNVGDGVCGTPLREALI